MSSVLTRDMKTMILFYGRQLFIDNEFISYFSRNNKVSANLFSKDVILLVYD